MLSDLKSAIKCQIKLKSFPPNLKMLDNLKMTIDN